MEGEAEVTVSRFGRDFCLVGYGCTRDPRTWEWIRRGGECACSWVCSHGNRNGAEAEEAEDEGQDEDCGQQTTSKW